MTEQDQEVRCSPFASMAEFVAIPRVGGLALSVDGARLVATVAGLDAEKKKWVTSLWELDLNGELPARRLTRGREGEGNPIFLPDGSLLFTSTRINPEVKDEGDKRQTLWCLPPGGEARALLTRSGGFSRVAIAKGSGQIAYATYVFGVDSTIEAEGEARARRKDAGVTAILHESYPVRNWDHDIGPGRPRVMLLPSVPSGPEDEAVSEGREICEWSGALPGDEYGADLQLSQDGSFLVLSAPHSQDGPFGQRTTVRRIDTTTGESLTIADREGFDFGNPQISPDGGRVALIASRTNTASDPGADTLEVVDLGSGESRQVAPEHDWYPRAVTWSADGTALFVASEQRGHVPVFRIDLDTGVVSRLTSGGAYSSIQVAPDGRRLYALRDHIDAPPTPVRLDPHNTDQVPQVIPAPGIIDVPGSVREVISAGDDGHPVRSFLVLPVGATAEAPVPLLVWIHGGPHSSWNSWSWRWSPWLMAAKGYAVLLPDPALSTGYGHEMLSRSYGAWGAEAFTDLMNATSVAEALPEIDQAHVAAMGGSFGGYMANWIATKTDKFSAIVTHASLWDLDHFAGTTDFSPYWMRQFGDPIDDVDRYRANSPHLGLASIRTPMLVIHGDRDYRVPIGQGLRLWSDLQRAGVTSKFLYYPDENHWVLTPGNHTVWYETVWAFLDEHVFGKKWVRPDLL